MEKSNFYDVTKLQLVTMWLFGAILFLVSINAAENDSLFALIGVLIPFFLIFYTLGWKANRK